MTPAPAMHTYAIHLLESMLFSMDDSLHTSVRKLLDIDLYIAQDLLHVIRIIKNEDWE